MDAENKITRAAIYTRVSTEDQAKEGFSLDAQLEKLKSYCKARDWEIAGEYIDDGYSGRYVKRPAYNRMMEEISKWDALLVIKMDRIHRNSKNFMMMMEYLKKEEKEFVSMTESLDTSTAMGRFVMDIIQRIAQLESEQIGERVYVGMEQKAKTNGGVLGFNIPYGYDYSNGKLTINHNESENVKNIFQNYLNGISMKKIAEELNLKSIPTKLNKAWGIQTVSLILKNPVYCGYLHWEDYLNPSDHPPIVDKNSFNEVQKLIQKKNIKTAHQSNIFIIE
ncbi:MAG: recombinase family protein [Candidatus Thermoplasmatota archaeon]|nr:recombinase family protein [Candidatus Thermoplasmatota archaeon]